MILSYKLTLRDALVTVRSEVALTFFANAGLVGFLSLGFAEIEKLSAGGYGI